MTKTRNERTEQNPAEALKRRLAQLEANAAGARDRAHHEAAALLAAEMNGLRFALRLLGDPAGDTTPRTLEWSNETHSAPSGHWQKL